jgi:hypothetical protein
MQPVQAVSSGMAPHWTDGFTQNEWSMLRYFDRPKHQQRVLLRHSQLRLVAAYKTQ